MTSSLKEVVDRRLRLVQHGTDAGYGWHARHRRPACAACLAAHAQAEQRRYERRWGKQLVSDVVVWTNHAQHGPEDFDS
jgi:hypothetical protein